MPHCLSEAQGYKDIEMFKKLFEEYQQLAKQTKETNS